MKLNQLLELTAGPRALWRSKKALTALGVVSAVVLTVESNVLVSRFYRRWDLTPTSIYTLSAATSETLAELEQPVTITVFLSRDDPLFTSVKLLLAEYQAQSSWLQTRYVDPDRDPAEFIKLQNEYGIFQGKTQDGRLVSETSIVVAEGAQNWLISADDLVRVEDSNVRPELEQALSEGLRRVLRKERFKVCLTTGHQELSTSNGGPRGAQELKYRLERDNFDVAIVDAERTHDRDIYVDCGLVVVAGPQRPWSSDQVEQLTAHKNQGFALLLALSPIIDENNRVISSGFTSLLTPLGLEAANAVVFETRPERTLAGPGGGVIFFAEPKTHPVTKGLVDKATPELVRAELSRPIDIARSSLAEPLLIASDKASKTSSLTNVDGASREPSATEGKPLVIAAALDGHGDGPERSGRLLVLGSATLLEGSIWQDARRIADKAFIESALAWLTARPPLLSIPARPAHPAGLNLSEDSLSEVTRYVLLYMPATALVLCAVTLWRRRRGQRRSPNRDASSIPGVASRARKHE